MLPWKFFNLTPRDAAGELIRTWNQYATTVTAAGLGQFNFTIPAEKTAIVTGFGAMVTNFGGGTPAFANLFLYDKNLTTILSQIAVPFPTQAGTTIHQNVCFTPCWLMAGERSILQVEVTQNAPSAATVMTTFFQAVLIPKGDATYL